MIIINAEFFKNDFLLILHEPKYLIITEDNVHLVQNSFDLSHDELPRLLYMLRVVNNKRRAQNGVAKIQFLLFLDKNLVLLPLQLL